MADNTPPEGASYEAELAAIRREIDGVDSTLLALFAQRLQLGDRLGAVKSSTQRLPIRPGREVVMLRRLVAEAPAPLERETVVELWRALMAANLRRQRIIEVVVGGGRGDPVRLYDIARRHFGARTQIKDVGEPQAALQRAAENPDSVVAVTTWPAAPGVGAWWPALSESRFHNLQIIAGLPLLGATGEPDAAVFAACDAEEAGGDVTMLLAFDPHHRLQRALNEFGFTGKEIARAEPRVLVRIEGFVGADDPRAAAMTRAGLDRVRVLGSYARI
jgi:chorismate mutase